MNQKILIVLLFVAAFVLGWDIHTILTFEELHKQNASANLEDAKFWYDLGFDEGFDRGQSSVMCLPKSLQEIEKK